MARYPVAFITVACTLGGACSREPAGPTPVLPLERVVSIQNAMTGIETPTRTLITDPATWAAAWADIFANYAPAQRPPLPAIDFASKIVVLAAAGLRGAQGFFFTIDAVRLAGSSLQVVVREQWPTCGTLPALSAPVDVVTVPRVATTATFTVIKDRPPSCP